MKKFVRNFFKNNHEWGSVAQIKRKKRELGTKYQISREEPVCWEEVGQENCNSAQGRILVRKIWGVRRMLPHNISASAETLKSL